MALLQNMHIWWKPVLEVAVFWFAAYLLFVYIKDSGMVQALKGLMFLVLLFFVAQVLELKSIRWVLSHLFQISIIGFLIIFQPELRRGLARIGQSPLFKIFLKGEGSINEIVNAVLTLSKDKTGALIGLEKEVGLKPYGENGISLDGILTSELLLTIFNPSTPFHDGGIIVQGDRVMAVGCVFPLSQSQKLGKTMGTRHRAALGLSEETDALVIVVSEETGIISVATQQKMVRNVDERMLRQYLSEHYQTQKTPHKRRLLFGRASA